jgi:diguanylate cyclase (GGDEF)-like protein
MIDVGHFKRINDEFGHATGDGVLRDLVSIIENRARKLDMLFRIGGEEFLLLLPDTREEDACKLGEDLRLAVADAFRLRELPVTVSVGVSEWHRDDDQDSWLKHADDALYLAKEMGRDRVVHRSGLYLLKSGRRD